MRRDALRRLQLPYERVLLRHQSAQVIRQQPPRFVRHPDEVAAIRRGGDALLVTKDLNLHELAAILGGDFADGDTDIDRNLGETLPHPVGKIIRRPLTRRRLILFIFDTQQNRAARRVGEADAIARESIRVLVLAERVTQRLLVKGLAFGAHAGRLLLK